MITEMIDRVLHEQLGREGEIRMSRELWFFVLIGAGVVLTGSLLAVLMLKYVLSLRRERAEQERARKEREAQEAEIAEMKRQAEMYKTGDWRSAASSIREALLEQRAKNGRSEHDERSE